MKTGLQRLADQAVADAEAHGLSRICLAVTEPMPIERIDEWLGSPAIAAVISKDDPNRGLLPAARRDDPRLGFYWAPGRWRLPQTSVPIYFLGPWWRLTPAMIVAAIRRNVAGLSVRCGPVWLRLPLPLIGRAGRLWRRLTGARAATEIATFDRLLGAARPEPQADGPIIHVCASLAPGGAERQLMYTLLGLHERGAAVQLLCDLLLSDHPARYDFFLPRIVGAGIPARAIRTRTADTLGDIDGLPPELVEAAAVLPPGLAADIANLYLEFRALKPAVVHAWLDWSNIRAGLAAALAGVPKIVLSGRNMNPSRFAFHQSYMRPAYQALCKLPNVVFLNNSQAGAEDYAAWLGLPAQRFQVIRNAIDFSMARRSTPAEREAFRSRYDIPIDAPLIGGAFRLFPEKQPLLWVDAAVHIARHCPSAQFVIFGEGNLRVEIEARAVQLGIADRFRLPGLIDDAASAISAMDLFLLTSYSEGLPNAVLEAQWLGIPVVATEAGGIREAIDSERTGWIVDRPAADAIAEIVIRILNRADLRAACATLGPAFVRRKFSMERMISATLNVYDAKTVGDSKAASFMVEQA
jgi:glycosyltransferase involved in cell wall biosynthesis